MAARGVNKVILIGRLGNDPEIKYMPNGNAVVNFSLATSEQWKDKSTGERQERTEWHRVVAFNRLAEIIGQYLKKGSNIYCEGKLQTRSWEKDGAKTYSTEVVISDMQMLDSRGGGNQSGQSQGYQQQRPQQSQQRPQQQQSPTDEFEDDIPF